MTRLNAPLPLDNGFLRRECPLCIRQFKVLLTEEELRSSEENGDEFLVEDDPDQAEVAAADDGGGDENTCPYCGQVANKNAWWTQEQLDYFATIAKNHMAQLINEHLVRPTKRMSSSFLKITATEVPESSTFLPPETNDMRVVELPCCNRKIKVADDHTGVVHCFFCGFPHGPTEGS